MSWEIKLKWDMCPYLKKEKSVKHYSLEEYKKKKVVPTRLSYEDYYNIYHSKRKHVCYHTKNKNHICSSSKCPIKVEK